MLQKGLFFTFFYLLLCLKSPVYAGANKAKNITKQDTTFAEILKQPLEKRLALNKKYLFSVTEGLSKPEKIAFWGEYFVGIKYDTILVGNYVQNMTIVDDSALDCMSHVFRSVELASAKNPEDVLDIAMDKRFIKQGQRVGNKVLSYDDRFQYGEDMVLSGKYGKNITKKIGSVEKMNFERINKTVKVLPASEAIQNIHKFKKGDIIFFVKNPIKRRADEIVGHMGILTNSNNKVFLLHASGTKKAGGQVKMVNFAEYIHEMSFFFPYILVTRFE